MLRKSILIAVFLYSSFSLALPRTGEWVGSTGIGLVGALFLLTPQVEYIHSDTVRYGGLVQLGLGVGTIATLSGSARYTFLVRNRKFQPFVEGALGLTIASLTRDSFGVHLMLAGGLDYQLTPEFSIGSTFRFNFAPPIDSFFISWPIAVGRLRF